jgi:hypothetical protein
LLSVFALQLRTARTVVISDTEYLTGLNYHFDFAMLAQVANRTTLREK